MGKAYMGDWSLLTRSVVSRVRLFERSVTKRTPINAICSGADNDVFTLNVQGSVGKIQRWFWSRRTKTAIQKQILGDTNKSDQRQSSNGHSFALMETLQTCGDLCIAPKVCSLEIIGHFWVLQGSQLSINHEPMAQDIGCLRAWMLSDSKKMPFRLAY
ncbi:hypothetical protein BASA83_007468 [Batrachochytrium salamandrivorans]|nr:hypothetical protein BASA83_007468 [Batrachochytrium salamandrivorans]